MTEHFRHDLEPAVVRAEEEIIRLVHEIVSGAHLRRIGPLDFGEPSWDCWIATLTDVDRDLLARDGALLASLQMAASAAGFAPRNFTFQSQETVDRDYEGRWFYAMR